jgi:biotin carboxylase
VPKVLLLSRQPLAQRPIQDWLDDPAHNVVLITSREAAAGSEDVLAQHFPRHRLVDDYFSWDTEQVAEEAARHYGVELVASTGEPDVIRAARLRGRLELTGQQSDSAIAYRDRVVMKRRARRGGIAVPAFAPVNDPLDLLDFVDELGYPVVVKPRFGAGASGVGILHGPRDVTAFLRRTPADPPRLPGQWMVESFVHGDLFHVHGIMLAGRIVHGWPSRYGSGGAEHPRGGSCLTSTMLAPDDERTPVLMGLAAEVIAALPPVPLPLAFHCAAWIGADGPVFGEIASRAGGGSIPLVYQRAFGVHLAKESLRAQCGSALTLSGQPAAPLRQGGWILFPAQRGRFTPPAGRCPVPGVDLTVSMEPGAGSAGLNEVDDAAAGAVVSGATAEQVRERTELAIRWWGANPEWTLAAA